MIYELLMSVSYISMLYGVFNFAKYVNSCNYNYYLPTIDYDEKMIIQFDNFCETNKLYGRDIYVNVTDLSLALPMLSLFNTNYEYFESVNIVINNHQIIEFMRNVSEYNNLQYFIIDDDFDVFCNEYVTNSNSVLIETDTFNQLCGEYFYNLTYGIDIDSLVPVREQNEYKTYYPFYNINTEEVLIFNKMNGIRYPQIKHNKYNDVLPTFLDMVVPNWKRFLIEYKSDKELMNDVLETKTVELFEDIENFDYGSIIPLFESETDIPPWVFKYIIKSTTNVNMNQDIIESLTNVINNDINYSNGELDENYMYFYMNRIIYIFNKTKLQEHFNNNMCVVDNLNENTIRKFLNGHYFYKCIGGSIDEHDYCSYKCNTLYTNSEPNDELHFIQSNFTFKNFGNGVYVGY